MGREGVTLTHWRKNAEEKVPGGAEKKIRGGPENPVAGEAPGRVRGGKRRLWRRRGLGEKCCSL